jgi:hypothetical protein
VKDDRYLAMGMALLVVAGLGLILCYGEPQQAALRWGIVSAGFAIAGALCYVASAILAMTRAIRRMTPEEGRDAADPWTPDIVTDPRPSRPS